MKLKQVSFKKEVMIIIVDLHVEDLAIKLSIQCMSNCNYEVVFPGVIFKL
jgi:hypothetical protein